MDYIWIIYGLYMDYIWIIGGLYDPLTEISIHHQSPTEVGSDCDVG